MLVGVAPYLIPALQNIGILHHKKAKLPKHLQHSVPGERNLPPLIWIGLINLPKVFGGQIPTLPIFSFGPAQ